MSDDHNPKDDESPDTEQTRGSSHCYRGFFARLAPFCEIAFSDEHKRLALIDYDSDRQLIEQQHAFLTFYRDNAGRWSRFRVETNGYIYAVDSDDVVIVSEAWLRDRSPDVEMTR